MSLIRSLHNETAWSPAYFSLDKLSPDFNSCGPSTFGCRQCTKSGASSTCHSDDSGIDGTVNLGPTSPLPEDTDSEDSTSLDSYHLNSSIGSNRRLFRPLTAKLYHDIPQGRDFNIAETAQLSPSGTCCMAATRDLHCSHSPHSPASISSCCSSSSASEFTIPEPKRDDNRFHILSYDQLLRLHEILTRPTPIHSRCASYPVIWARLSDLFQAVRENLHSCGVLFRDMRLNGGVASYVIGMDSSPTYNDIDVLISVDLSSDTSAIHKVKSAVLDALMRFLPDNNRFVTDTLSGQSNVYHPPVGQQLNHYGVSQSKMGSDQITTDGFSTDTPVQSQMRNFSPILRNEATSELVNDLPLKDLSLDATSSIPESATTSDSLSPLSPDTESRSSISPRPQTVHLSPPSTLHSGSFNSPTQCVPLPAHSGRLSDSPIGNVGLRESYIYKQFRKYGARDADCWSLLSLGIPSGQSKVLEFKFVDRMRRQFEFTVDSFQILLDPILSFIQANPNTDLTRNFYPTVVAESVAGSFSLAFHHLKNKLILTKEPEMIRGGGLLKYCRLLVNGYQAPNGIDVCSLERYMSSRFFIDFQDLESQKAKIEAFLANHFTDTEVLQKIDFLKTVYRVVSGSTICLMSFERYQTLNLICSMLHQLNQQIEMRRTVSLSLDWLTEKQNLVIDRIYLGTHLFPVISSPQLHEYACCQCAGATAVADIYAHPDISSNERAHLSSRCTRHMDNVYCSNRSREQLNCT